MTKIFRTTSLKYVNDFFQDVCAVNMTKEDDFYPHLGNFSDEPLKEGSGAKCKKNF